MLKLEMRPLFRNSRFLTGLTLAVLALALWAGVALALYQDPREARALRTPGAIVGATYGNEPLVLGANWQKWLLRLCPALLHDQFGGASLRPEFVTPKAPFTIWWTFGRDAPMTGPGVLAAYKLTNERGESMGVLTIAGGMQQVGDYRVCTLPVDTYPRRGKQIRILLEPSGRSVCAGSRNHPF